MNARTKLAFFRDDEDDDLSGLQSKPIDDHKAKTFGQGINRKTKREKEKEAEAAKREEEERDAARAYAEFLDAFDAPDAEGPAPTAVKTKGKPMGFVRATDAQGRAEAYEARSTPKEVPSGPRRERFPSPPPIAAGPPKPKGKRAMDSFLEELKRDQADREARLKGRTQTTGNSVSALAAFEGQVGSRDRGDPLTTNVFVANLPLGITEHNLGMFFARHGPVGSVKIMWPRSEAAASTAGPGGDITARRGKSSGMSGFVSYMTRKAAEACVRDMDGHEWNGSVLRVGWSKAVPIAAKPAYVLEDERPRGRRSRSLSRSRSRSDERRHDRDRRPAKRARYSRSRSGSYSPQRSRSPPPRRRSSSPRRSRSRSPRRKDRHRRDSRSPSRSHERPRKQRQRSFSRSRSRSRSPEQRRWPPIDDETKEFVIGVAHKVKNHGSKFGDVLKHRERANPKYTFLFDKRLPEYHLFRSISESNYRCPFADIPFRDDGYNSVYSTDSGEESERDRVRKGSLGRLAERRFESMLRALTGRRGEIARCMAFSLEHAEAVTEVVDIIISSLVVPSTAVPRKIARLNLICDILHNSAATIPNAWKFRGEFEKRLPAVFDHLSEIYHSFPGRITAETFKKQVLAVVEVWEDWIVFPPDFTSELRRRLDGIDINVVGDDGMDDTGHGVDEVKPVVSAQPAPSKFKSGGFKPAPAEDDMDLGDSDADEAPAPGPQAASGVDDDDDDIEGEAIALDGEQMEL